VFVFVFVLRLLQELFVQKRRYLFRTHFGHQLSFQERRSLGLGVIHIHGVNLRTQVVFGVVIFPLHLRERLVETVLEDVPAGDVLLLVSEYFNDR